MVIFDFKFLEIKVGDVINWYVGEVLFLGIYGYIGIIVSVESEGKFIIYE